MLSTRNTSIPEFAARIAARPEHGEWAVLLAEANRTEEVARELVEELRISAAAGAELISAETTRELVRRIMETGEPVRVVSGNPAFTAVEWSALDLMRSRYENARKVVLVLSPEQGELLSEYAPNLASWIAGGFWSVDEQAMQLTGAEAQQRLLDLQTTFGVSNDDVIRQAEEKSLPSDPEFVEWLVLLNRSDLIER